MKRRRISFHLYYYTFADKLGDVFLVSAVSSILLLRLYLHLTNYPQVGGSLHIAHMLWGGLLMMMALCIALFFIGRRVRLYVAVVGGIGFGVFIDELGKFITRDHNYFFQPTIALLYALFVIVFLIMEFALQRRTLSSEERQLNALLFIEESVHQDMDVTEQKSILAMLHSADPSHPLTGQLMRMVRGLPTVEPREKRRSVLGWLREKYRFFARQRDSSRKVRALFAVLFLVLFVGGILFLDGDVLAPDYASVESAQAFGRDFWLSGQIVSSSLAEICLLIGMVIALKNRVRAMAWLYRAVLLNLLLTQFFLFARFQFGALVFLIVNLALFLLVRFVLAEERLLAKSTTPV